MALEDAAREARAAYEVARRTGASRGRSSVDASWWEKREAQKRAVVDAFVRRSVDDDSFWRAVDDAMGDDAGCGFAHAVLGGYARSMASNDVVDGEMKVDDETRARDDSAFVERAMRAMTTGADAMEADGDGTEDDVDAAHPCEVAQTCRYASEAWCRGRAKAVDGRTLALALGRARARALGEGGRSPSMTPQDAAFLRVCVEAKAYDVAVESGILTTRVSEASDPAATGLVADDYIARCYYGGCALLALHRYDDAVCWLRDAVAAPVWQDLSAIASAGYKKYILASLLSRSSDRTRAAIPSSVSGPVRRFAMSRHVESYDALVSVMSLTSLEKLNETIEKYQTAYEEDGNAGLVDLLRERVQIDRVRAVAKTYSKLSLSEFARLLNLTDAAHAETMLHGMVSRGEVEASVDGILGVVLFAEGWEKPKSKGIATELTTRLRAIADLTAKIRDQEAEITRSRVYVQRKESRSQLAEVRAAETVGERI